MLARLRHHALVRGDDEQAKVDSTRSHEHAPHEVLVARNVDHADGADPGEIERREAEIDRYAATLFFGQAVGVDTGQRLDERGLAVIDVARGADDHAALQRSCSHTANARSGRSSVRWAPRNSRRSR